MEEQSDRTKKTLQPKSWGKLMKVWGLLAVVIPEVGNESPTLKSGIIETSQFIAVPFSVHENSTVVDVKLDSVKLEGDRHCALPLKKAIITSKLNMFFMS